MFFKKVPPGGDKWNGISLPLSTEVGYYVWGVEYDEEF